MKTRTCLLETQGRETQDEGPPHRCHHTVDEYEKSLFATYEDIWKYKGLFHNICSELFILFRVD